MHAILRLLLPFLATAVAYVLLQLVEILIRDLRSSLRKLPGPPTSSFVYGNLKDLESTPQVTRSWRKQFGRTFQFTGILKIRELYTADTLAIEHIVKNNYVYQKLAVVQPAQERLAGEGLLGVEGDAHRRQRRVMNPAFGTAQVRNLMPVFIDKSIQLRDIWMRQISEDASKAPRIEVYSWLSKMTLDVIGEAGFDYRFDTLNADPKRPTNEVHDAFNKLFRSPNQARRTALRLVQPHIPLLRYMPLPGRKAFNNARNTLFSLGRQLIADSKAELTAAGGPDTVSSRRDLFSLLLKANMSPDIQAHQRISDEEVIGQIPTFFIAGHATTSSAIAWALHALSLNQSAQSKLRAELLTVPSDSPTLDAINALPYLDAVVRETLRVHAPVAHVMRIAATDDVLPLRTPWVDRLGRTHENVMIKAGDRVRVPIADINADPEIWGSDAEEFRPERWQNVPTAADEIPSIWSNLLTFFAGPHSCIGFRFSLAEQKALLFVLIRAFEFTPAVAADNVRKTSSALTAPYVASERAKGSQMPLLVRPYQA